MATFNTYLNFNGNTEEAFTFYKSVIGGEFETIQRFGDTPGSGIPENLSHKIMHISLPIGNGNALMATDALEELGQKVIQGNNFYISINAESKEEANKLYNGLSVDGAIEMEIGDTFWGAYFGMFKDKFGIQWIVNFDYPKA